MESSLNPFYDFTIIGAGASGLFLAQALMQYGLLDNQTLCIVESDTTKHNDRTWCYWSQGPITADPFVSKVWGEVRNLYLQSSGMHPYQYHHIHSADFYRHMKSELGKCRNIHWLFDKVLHATQHSEAVRVDGTQYHWTTGKVFTAAAVNQTPLQPSNLKCNKKHVHLKQSFVGWRVHSNSPVFTAEQMTLMDFNIPQQNHTQFLYVLPFTSNEALLELTRFGSEELSRQEAEVELKQQMDALNCSYTIREVETGCIPMSTLFDATQSHHPVGNNIIPIGTLAGAIKPTTGYGFKRMHAHAQVIAQALLQKEPIPTTKRKYRFRLYDVLLLTILQKYPEQGKPIFEQLFKSQPLPRILKFLDEETTIREELLIFAKLPIPLFVRTLLKHALGL